MFTRAFTFFAALLVAIGLAQSSTAQNGGGMSAFGSGGSGGFGSSGMGGFGSSGMGGGGFGSSGMGGGGFGSGGMGGFGSSGMGGSGGMGGFGSSGRGNSGFGGGGMGSSGFGNNSQPGANPTYVGRGGGQNQQNGAQGNKAMNQFFTNANRQMSRNNKNGKKSSGSSGNPPQPMRMEIQVGFAPPAPTNAVVATRIQTRLTKILADHHMSQPLITVQGDTAVISGTAASDSERLTIAQLVSLEQGVRDVRNEMTVAGEPVSAPTPPQQPGS